MSEFYGRGDAKDDANPFFPNETNWEGPSKTIASPYGSTFELDIAKGNTFEDRLSNSGSYPGHTTMAEDSSRKMGEKRRGGRS
jgi:hypothetical protein